MLNQNNAALEELLKLEIMITDKYKSYMEQVDSGEMRKTCENIISKHKVHINNLQNYVER
jgi:hypothetical protein